MIDTAQSGRYISIPIEGAWPIDGFATASGQRLVRHLTVQDGCAALSASVHWQTSDCLLVYRAR